MKKKLVIILIALVILVGGGAFYYHQTIDEPIGKNEIAVVTIDQGDTSHTAVEKLYKAGLISSEFTGNIYSKLEKLTLTANTYKFNKNMNIKEMLKAMHNADSRYVVNNKLQIKDGASIREIAADVAACLTKLEKKTVTSEDVINGWRDPNYLHSLENRYWFIDSSIEKAGIKYPLEGYFYPETYYINEKNPTLDTITTKMLDKMNERLTPYKDQIAAMKMTPHQFLTLSSIVEGETLFNKDRPKIAGVFMNRLHKNMYLQSDITVNYALGRKGVKVSKKMLKKKSPYNTYLHKGLPIGPVSTVQDQAFEAVAHYQKSDDYYFFAKKDGSVIYSKTYKEHQKAVKENKWY